MATTGFKFIRLTIVDTRGDETGVLDINPDHIIGYFKDRTFEYTIIYTNIPGYPQYRVAQTPEQIEDLANA
jgi:hypothetical protein